MEVFLVIYTMGMIAGTTGPLRVGNEKESLEWCNNYIKEELQPKYDKAWNDPDKVEKMMKQFPNGTKDTILKYKCEVHSERPENTLGKGYKL